MSAWYVFSALGFFPANPASGDYVLGSPLVSRAVLHLDPAYYPNARGHTFTVVAQNNSTDNAYIQSATLNGTPLKRSWFTHAELARGGELRLVMGPKPNKSWGAAPADRPRSGMPAGTALPALPTPAAPPVPPAQLTLPARLSATGAAGFASDEPTPTAGVPKARRRLMSARPTPPPPPSTKASGTGRRWSTPSPCRPAGRTPSGCTSPSCSTTGRGCGSRTSRSTGCACLTDFEIFKAAGGLNKAVVKRVLRHPARTKTATSRSPSAAAASSPDQNAKVSGIEILEQP